MPVFSVEGRLGSGKTKFCVWMAQQALRSGRKVASNVDLYLDKLVPEKSCYYVRISDKPTALDFEAIGHGNPGSYDEDKNGLLILDELGTWLNSRSFQDKGRAAVIDWLIHARKLGWDVYLIVQDAGMIDRQVRESLIEYQCRCLRTDKLKMPLIGWILNGIFGGRAGFMPRMHLVTSRMGFGGNQVVADRWHFRGDDLHAAYDTRQVFRSDYPHGPHSVLRLEPVKVPLSIRQLLGKVLAKVSAPPPVRPPLKPKRPEVLAAMGLPGGVRFSALRLEGPGAGGAPPVAEPRHSS